MYIVLVSGEKLLFGHHVKMIIQSKSLGSAYAIATNAGLPAAKIIDILGHNDEREERVLHCFTEVTLTT